jgi:hypothetical protein
MFTWDGHVETSGLPEERQPYIRGEADLGLYYPNYGSDSENFPSWTDPDDVDGRFKQDYEDYVRAIVTQFKGKVHMYRVALEVNIGQWTGALTGRDYEWAVEWIKWQCDLIHSIDPDVLICVDLADERISGPWEVNPQTISWQEWQSYGLLPPQAMYEDEFVQMLIDAEVDFDVIGLEVHPGWNTNLKEIDDDLTLLEQFNKPIYIWETFVPSADDPDTVDMAISRGEYPEGGYTEEFQRDQLLALFRMVMEDHPMVIGIQYLGFVDNPQGVWELSPGEPVYGSLLRADGTPKPAYNALKDYWFSLFANGEATTDTDGEISFQGLAGIYEVTIQKEGYESTEENIHAVKGEENVFTFTLEAIPTEEEPTCIIATATYGSELAPEVRFLRGFRDNIVLSTFAGSQFMRVFNDWYYSFSLSVASFIAQQPVAKAIMKVALYPLIGTLHLSSMAYSAFFFSPELGVVIAGLVASSLIGIVYFTLPATILLAIVKRFKKKTLKTKQFQLLVILWLISVALMLLGEITFSSTLMMAATVSFVLVTLASSVTVVASKITQRFP